MTNTRPSSPEAGYLAFAICHLPSVICHYWIDFDENDQSKPPPIPGAIATKPGSATRPFPGVVPEIVTMDGKPVPDGSGGFLILKRPWPGMLRTVYGDPARYVQN